MKKIDQLDVAHKSKTENKVNEGQRPEHRPPIRNPHKLNRVTRRVYKSKSFRKKQTPGQLEEIDKILAKDARV